MIKFARKLVRIGQGHKSLEVLLKEVNDLLVVPNGEVVGSTIFKIENIFDGEEDLIVAKPWCFCIVYMSVQWRRRNYCTRFPSDSPEGAIQMFLDYCREKSITRHVVEEITLSAMEEAGRIRSRRIESPGVSIHEYD